MDGDGQHDPKYLSKVTDAVESGKFEMAIGSRFIEKEGFQTMSIFDLTGKIIIVIG